MKKFLLIIFTLILITSQVASFGADSNVTYSGENGDFVFEPGSSESLTDLFPDFKNVMPGDKLTQKIKVVNNASESVKVKIYIRSLGSDEGSKEFLGQLKLTVKKTGETPLFEGPSDVAGDLSKWTEIGILSAGAVATLELTLEVPTGLGNDFQNQEGKITWQFMAIEMPTDENPWICPNCHESHYYIEDHEDHCDYVCENCGHREEMVCEECGGHMHKVIYRTEDGKVWYYYQCLDVESHHTEPIPGTGDNGNLWIWIFALVVSASLIVNLAKRRRVLG